MHQGKEDKAAIFKQTIEAEIRNTGVITAAPSIYLLEIFGAAMITNVLLGFRQRFFIDKTQKN